MRRVAISALLGALLGCQPQGTADFTFSSDKATFDGRTERAVVTVSAVDERGQPGTGVVLLTTAVGSFVEGSQLALVSGQASATFRCNPSEEPACAGQVRLGASWRGEARALSLRVTPADAPSRPLWRVVPTLQPVTLYAAAQAPDRTVWAVGERGTVMPFLSSGAWGAPVATGVTSTLRAIWVASDGSLTIAGDDGVVLTGPPASLRRLQHTQTASFTAVVRHAGALMLATSAGGIATWDSNDFLVTEVSTRPLNALVTLGSDAIAAGDEGLFRFDGARWVAMAPPVLARWQKAHVDADGLWALGRRATGSQEPVLVQGPGPDWKSASLPTGAVQAMAWGAGTADRYVVTDVTVFRQQVGGSWEDLDAPSGGTALVHLGGTSLLVLGPPGVSLVRVR